MFFFFANSDKTKCLSGHGRIYMASQWDLPDRIITLDIIMNEGGQASDYGWLEVKNPPGGIEKASEIFFTLDGQENPSGISTWNKRVAITGAMQLTVGNGNYALNRSLNLPLADRQINITADPTYDKTFELYIIYNQTSGAVDVAWCENGAALPSGWSVVVKLLSGIIPAGTTDISMLNLAI